MRTEDLLRAAELKREEWEKLSSERNKLLARLPFSRKGELERLEEDKKIAFEEFKVERMKVTIEFKRRKKAIFEQRRKEIKQDKALAANAEAMKSLWAEVNVAFEKYRDAYRQEVDKRVGGGGK